MRIHRPRLTAAQMSLLAAAIAAGFLSAAQDRWDLLPLALIALFMTVSELMVTRLDGESGTSGGLLGVVLVAALYGPGPAAAVAVFILVVGWPQSRESGWVFRGNVAACAAYSMAVGLAFHAMTAHVGRNDPLFELAVFAAFLAAMLGNVAGIVTLSRSWHGAADALRAAAAMLKPVLAAELFAGLLTVAAVLVVLHLHIAGLVMLGIVLAIFQYLVGELLTSRRRGVRLKRIATTDELTGLANRERFRQAIDERIAAARECGGSFPVLLMDLDRFKEVNDTLGHSYGDRLLRELGPRLRSAIGSGGFVARLGGDEFGIVLDARGTDSEAMEVIVARLIAAVSEPFRVDELALEVGASIGAAHYPADGEDSHALMRCADVAMYAAKEAQTDFKRYAADQNEHSLRRLSVLSDIRRALAGDEIVVHYQPIVDLEDRSVIGAEGLVRWEHPDHGLIPPAAFVQTVEQSGLIGPLTRRVLEHSISQCADWRAAGREMSVAVNLSVRNLLDRDLPREIEGMLRDHGVPASALQLEITESMIMSDPERALATVTRLSDLGVRLSVDDFGTGYSSLANLRRLPINELKIDRSFVSPMLADESDLIIVRSTINLGHDLGLRIIAEGVEDGETLERLAALGCDRAQGYHLSRPLGAASFNKWLAEGPEPPGSDCGPMPAGAGWTPTASGLVVASPER